MAPGDLNLKKSWHPGLMKNQQKVWEKEQEVLAERKKIQERQEEILKEKELAELRELQYAKTGKKVTDRVEWMYDTSGVSDGNKLMSNDAEEYLLGKKRVDDLIIQKQAKQKDGVRGFDKVRQGMSGMISQREEVNRSREDPMAKINAQRMKKMQEKTRTATSHRYREKDNRHHHRSSRDHADREYERRSKKDDSQYRYRDEPRKTVKNRSQIEY